MGMLDNVIGFIIGKSPKIFDKDGSVRHDLGPKKWDDWNKRYHEGAEYNWRNHTGMKGGDKSAKKDKRP